MIDMKNLISTSKVLEIKTKFLPIFLRPDILLNNITELDTCMIFNLKEKYDIQGIILDVDETLRKNMQPIPVYIKEWLENLIKNIKVIVLSNGYDKRVEDYLKNIGITYISLACKPMRRGFLKSALELNIKPNKILVIGDSLVDDILGGKISGMMTGLVKKLK